MDKWTKIDRFSAWVLFFTMLAYFVSGYGMSKGLIDANLATKLHLSYLTYFVLVSFIFHTAFATRLALIRWNVWQNYGKFVWILFFVLFISGFIYLDRLYTKQGESQPETSETSVTTPTNDNIKTENNTPSKTFNASELAKYDGQNGNPAYLAVDGVVYDLTSVFSTGVHFGHYAGKELTNAFYTRHVKSSITKYPVVGTYQP